jgi:hypothetical protein
MRYQPDQDKGEQGDPAFGVNEISDEFSGDDGRQIEQPYQPAPAQPTLAPSNRRNRS